MIFGGLLTSSNHENKLTDGRNNYGAKFTNIYLKRFTQSLASIAISVNGTVSVINRVDERPETPVQRPVRSEHAVESESLSSTVDTTESTASTVPTSPETASDADASAARCNRSYYGSSSG